MKLHGVMRISEDESILQSENQAVPAAKSVRRGKKTKAGGLGIPARLDSVQLLRAVAAIAVVTHHVPVMGNGRWGVDLFFAISGFIMCHVTELSSRNFLVKRVIRVVPLYWAGTIGVFAVALVAPNWLNSTSADVVSLLKSLAFIPFQKGDGGYYPMLFLGWTLNYEMFFYLLFYLSMRVSHRHRVEICSALLIIAVVLGQTVPVKSDVYVFFTRPIILEFLFGMLCYVLLTRSSGGQRIDGAGVTAAGAWWLVLGAGMLAAMPLTSGLATDEGRAFIWGPMAAVALFAVVSGLGSARLPTSIVLIGDASYSLYLFHPYIVQMFDKVFHSFSTTDIQAYIMAGVVIVLCCTFAIVLYRYVEKPVSEFLRERIL